PATGRRLPCFLHCTLLSSHASTLRQTKRGRASLPSRTALRKPDDLAHHLLRRFAIGVDLRVRLTVERIALLVQLTHARHRVLTYYLPTGSLGGRPLRSGRGPRA